MAEQSLFTSFFLIFSGAAILATIALYTRQPLLVAYIVLGALLGPYGLQAVSDTSLLADIAHIGIIFLLFLLGLDMQPSHLVHMIKKATLVALFSSAIFLGMGYGLGLAFGFTQTESLVIGAALMFSSTIIGIKLLPTTVLHHRHTGELVVGLLLLQDVIAILVLLMLNSGSGQDPTNAFVMSMLALPTLALVAWLFVRYIILPLLMRFDRFHEYVFLVAIGWCLGMSEAAELAGLSAEMGAFIGGVALATSPISQYIASSLKPLRDFFLILFFFSVGASFNLTLLDDVLLPAIALTLAVLIVKPVVFRTLLQGVSESGSTGWEIGFRLGQISEFSLLIAYLAFASQLIGTLASHAIQATAILSFLLSTYVVIFRYPSPIAVKDSLRRD